MRSPVWMVLVLACSGAVRGQGVDAMRAGFHSPPDSAKPRTWWHWTNGNVTEDGITKDLEWMKRSGIAGFQLADVASGGGQVVERKINFGTPEWFHAVRHSAEEAKRLGLEMTIFSSPGWSEAGGPWVTPEHAMKKLVWSETEVAGGQRVNVKLAMPPSNEGPVRDLMAGTRGAGDPPHFYRDSATLAFRTPADDVPMMSLHPRVTTNSGSIDGAPLMDGSLNTTVALKPSSGADGKAGPAWLQYEFTQPYTARAFTIGSRGRIPVGRLVASDDGAHFRTVVTLPGPQGYHGAPVRTFAFPAETAKFFRLEIDGAGLLPAAVIHGGPAIPATEYVLSEAILYPDARVDRWEDKGAFGSLMDVYDVVPTPAAPRNALIATSDVADVTAKVDADGTLHWDAPPGRWTVLRMGYSLTGAKNRPATAAGSGYEVDKLNADDVRSYFGSYLDPIQGQLGELTGSTLQYMMMDSWEAGMQNWTDNMIGEFQQRRGYDPRPMLPVLAGHVVGSAEASDRFLWDFRRTLADMIAENFYGTMDNELKKRGMGLYSEASGVALEVPEDTLLNKSKVDIPMAEFWVHALHPESMYYVDVRGAASAAHAYGKPIVATESFTGGGYESPYTLKKVADYWFAQGVNRLVFHTSAQQPLDTKPGNTMVGTHLNRNITWAEQAKPFMTYVARVSYMEQQGKPVTDLAYLLPEGAPSTMPFWGAGLQPAPPAGYDYDYLNTDLLLHAASVSADGRLTLASGASYRLLLLPPTTEMTPEVLHKLHDLVAAGVTLLGPRPLHSPSLSHADGADAQLRSLGDDLWGDMDGVTATQHAFGKGMTYWGLTPADVLERLHAPADFLAEVSSAQTALPAAPVWNHRRTADADIYYIANQADVPVDVHVRFRVTGRLAEVWRPMTGESTEMSARGEGDFTEGTLHLTSRETAFAVLRPTAAVPVQPVQGARTETMSASLAGPWQLHFAQGRGAPMTTLTEHKLASWTDSPDPGVKYFSGTATYSRTLQAPATWFHAGQQISLDLGDVRDIAEVSVNGTTVGVVWAPPYRVDISHALKAGANRIEIRVTNEWTNRLLGDRLVPAEKRVLDVPTPPAGSPGGGFRNAPAAPPPSGLLGPVFVVLEQTVP